MTVQAIREFSGRYLPASTGLAGLVAALEARATGVPLEPSLAARIQELLAALGGDSLLDGLSADEARALVPEIRQNLRSDSMLANPESRSTSWSYADPRFLQEVGEFSRAHAVAISKMIIPNLEGLGARFASSDASFLDIGVGVAGTAVSMAEQWPSLRIVGIDVWQPSLALARQNVAAAKLEGRIELREQAAENLDDDQKFDLAWMPTLFMPERSIPQAVANTKRALRPGGWLIAVNVALDGVPPPMAAMMRLRVVTFGGPLRTAAEQEELLKSAGFTDVRTLPRPPHVPASFTVGRRPT
jgi:predicted O-methyltransferase YrrM